MAASTRVRLLGPTPGLPFTTKETAESETPASAATSRIFGWVMALVLEGAGVTFSSGSFGFIIGSFVALSSLVSRPYIYYRLLKIIGTGSRQFEVDLATLSSNRGPILSSC